MNDEVYKRYTECFKKENDLINNRITWLLTTQVFLFAALEYVKHTEQLTLAVVIVGLVSSFGFFLCILAAIMAYFRFYFNIPKKYKKHKFPETYRNKFILFMGFTGPFLTPIVLIWAWSYLLYNLYSIITIN